MAKSPKYWIVQGVFFTDTVWIVGPLGQAITIKLRLFVPLITYSSAITRSAKSSVAKTTLDSENLDY